jgi:hypothetical protein
MGADKNSSLWLNSAYTPIATPRTHTHKQDPKQGSSRAHIGTRALGGKAIKQGFYTPTINIDAKALVRQCEACQKTTNQQN